VTAYEWALDIAIGTYNRPKVLYAFLKTGLGMNLPGVRFIVIDDASEKIEDVPGLGACSTSDVFDFFACDRVLYIKKETNKGVCANIIDFYANHCSARYVMRACDKDEFINKVPIENAIAKLDADKELILVQIPLTEKNQTEDHKQLSFNYSRMNGKEYISHYIRDTHLQHSAAYAIHRVATAKKAGVPRSLHLRKHGLADLFGFDVDFILKIAATGGYIEFETEPHVRRSTIGGATEKSPLLFAYCYYQYAKRAMRDLRQLNMISRKDMQYYLSWWHLLLLRGLVVIYQPSESRTEKNTTQIHKHLKIPILLYYALECIRYNVFPDKEKRLLIKLYFQIKAPKIYNTLTQIKCFFINSKNRIKGKIYGVLARLRRVINRS
jgi:hypothetical protein